MAVMVGDFVCSSDMYRRERMKLLRPYLLRWQWLDGHSICSPLDSGELTREENAPPET